VLIQSKKGMEKKAYLLMAGISAEIANNNESTKKSTCKHTNKKEHFFLSLPSSLSFSTPLPQPFPFLPLSLSLCFETGFHYVLMLAFTLLYSPS
jgi:hypothetical protein